MSPTQPSTVPLITPFARLVKSDVGNWYLDLDGKYDGGRYGVPEKSPMCWDQIITTVTPNLAIRLQFS